MPQHELAVRPIVWAGAAIGATVAAVIAVVLFTLHHAHVPAAGERLQPPLGLEVPGPALQSAPQVDLLNYRHEKARLLGETRWVDARHGVARIPVTQAMTLLEQGAASAPGAGR